MPKVTPIPPPTLPSYQNIVTLGYKNSDKFYGSKMVLRKSMGGIIEGCHLFCGQIVKKPCVQSTSNDFVGENAHANSKKEVVIKDDEHVNSKLTSYG